MATQCPENQPERHLPILTVHLNEIAWLYVRRIPLLNASNHPGIYDISHLSKALQQTPPKPAPNTPRLGSQPSSRQPTPRDTIPENTDEDIFMTVSALFTPDEFAN